MKHPDRKTLESWKEMTAANAHGEVRVKIAEWLQSTPEWDADSRNFGQDFAACFRYINLIHREVGHIPHELCLIRNVVTGSMLGVVERYDKDAADEIVRCL